MVPIVEPVKGSPLPQLLVPRYLHEESGDNGRYPRQPYSSSSGQAAQDAIGHHHQGSTGKVESKTGNRLSGSARIENGFSSSTEDEVFTAANCKQSSSTWLLLASTRSSYSGG